MRRCSLFVAVVRCRCVLLSLVVVVVCRPCCCCVLFVVVVVRWRCWVAVVRWLLLLCVGCC